MTPAEATAAAAMAAETIRSLNHATLPGTVEIDVTDLYDLLAEDDQVVIDDGDGDGDGDEQGDPVAAAVITGHWLAAAAGTAGELAHHIDHAQQALTWAARPDPIGK